MLNGGESPDYRPGGLFEFQSQDFQQPINDFFPGIIYVYDMDSRKLRYVNKKVTDILGYSFDDFKTWDNDFAKVIFKDDVDLVQKELDKFNELKDDQSHSYQCRFNRKEGDWLHFTVSGKVLRRDANGKPTSLLLVAQDIESQIKQAAEVKALQELKEDNEELLQFGNWTWNPQTDVLMWSRGMFKLMDMNPDAKQEPITLSFFLSHVPERERLSIKNDLEVAQLRKDKTVEFQYNLTTSSKEAKIFYSKAKIIYDAEGKAQKVIGTTRDITQIGTYEQELKRKIAELDHSNRELEDFAYAASHDLQEPLRKISTLSDRLQSKFSESFPEDVSKYLDRIKQSARSAQTLIDSLMEFSRIKHATMTFERADLNEIFDAVKSELELKIDETGTSLRSDKLPELEVSRLQVRQLFSNIILNAIKFRKEGIPLVIEIKSRNLKPQEIKEHHLESTVPYVLLTFKDNGIGFEETYSSIIFQMFSRLHGKSEYPGAGIGLALCKKIVESHHGQIYAKGIPGEGATFFVILPERIESK